MTSIDIFSIVVYRYFYKYKSCLVILLFIDKYLKISLYDIYLFLDLAISLKIKSDKKLLLNIKEII